jgi:hypothetical protein
MSSQLFFVFSLNFFLNSAWAAAKEGKDLQAF